MELVPKVEVLLATYNGGKYVQEQIESIIGQEYENLTVLARDDGSTDGTVDILKESELRYPNRFRLAGASPANGGILNNFLSLMKASTAPYVCFCDQDDIWLSDKVRKTKAVMVELEQQCGQDTPLLVFTDLRVVDEDLNTLHPSFWKRMGIEPERIDDFSRLLPSPVVTGCTMMANRRLIELASAMPAEASLHDRWIALLASAMGKAAYLPEPTVLYRQHGRNAIGVGKDQAPRTLFRRIRESRANARLYVKVWQACQTDATAFLRVYGTQLPPNIRRAVNAFVRCESSHRRSVRLATFLTHNFHPRGTLSRLAIASYLWMGGAGWSRKMEHS